MDEANKTNRIRDESFFIKYFSGSVLDIGAGEDMVCKNAQRFDLEDGDANCITKFIKNQFDTVHSSHCLEHMYHPSETLIEWWSLIKPGGYLVLVVPDEDLYEQGFWPSIFNSDHKNTFRLRGVDSWSPCSHNIVNLVEKLPFSKIISKELQDNNYDYTLRLKYDSPKFIKEPVIFKYLKKITRRIPLYGENAFEKLENYLHHKYGIPIDQTRRNALAQIQIIAQKIND